MRAPLLSILIFAFGILGSCSSDGGKTSIKGFLNPALKPTDQAVPSNPIVTVMGRSPDEFSVDFRGQDIPAWPLEFDMGGIPSGEPIVFQVRGGDLYGAASFPIYIDSNQGVNLGAITADTVQAIKEDWNANFGGVTSTNAGIIMGIVAPTGGNPFRRVTLVRKTDGKPDPIAQGPFYFTANGQIDNGSEFEDNEGRYVFFNVPPGNYDARFSGAQDVTVEVLSIRGQVSFGYDIP